MKLFKSTLIVVLGFAVSVSSPGQSVLNLPPASKYEKAIVGFRNYTRLDVESLVLKSDSVSWYSRGELERSDYKAINYIKVRAGNKGGSGAIIGGVSVLVASLAGLIQAKSDPNLQLRSNAGSIVALFTVGGGAVGGLIGCAIPRYKSYYVHAVPER